MGAGSGYRFGEFVLNLDRGCLQEGGTDLALRPKAFEVLRCLVERAGRLATKDELVQEVWPNVIVSDDSLAQCIRDTRKVLSDDGERFIKTIPRRGYMFVADTTPLGAVDGPSLFGPPWAPPGGRDAAATSWLSWSRLSAPHLTIAAVAALIVLVAVVAVSAQGWFARQPGVTDARLTIAVLPFTTLTEKPGEDWFGDGIAEDIMTAVSRFRDLTVISRNSSFRYRGDAVDMRQAAKELGAHYLLQGSVRRSGDRLRITVQLVDPRTGTSRWSERYDRPLSDVFAIQEDVAEKVAAQLVVHAKEAAAARVRTRPPAGLEVYELVLRGRKMFETLRIEAVIEGRALFQQAIAIDPNYAPAWQGLAAAHMQLFVQPYSSHQGDQAMLQRSRAAAETAAALDANFASGQATLGIVLTWMREHEAGLDALRRAIRLNPNDDIAHMLHAQALSYSGFFRESLEAWDRAQQLNPYFPGAWFGLRAAPHIMLRDFEPALRLGRSCVERAPQTFFCFLYLAVAAKELGLEEEANKAVRRLRDIYPKFTIRRHMQIYPLRNEPEVARFADYLRRLGLPE